MFIIYRPFRNDLLRLNAEFNDELARFLQLSHLVLVRTDVYAQARRWVNARANTCIQDGQSDESGSKERASTLAVHGPEVESRMKGEMLCKVNTPSDPLVSPSRLVAQRYAGSLSAVLLFDHSPLDSIALPSERSVQWLLSVISAAFNAKRGKNKTNVILPTDANMLSFICSFWLVRR